MARRLKADEVLPSLAADLAAKAADIRSRYGSDLPADQLERLLHDPQLSRFPCEIRFDAAPLLPGEFGHVVQKGPTDDQGFILYLHPRYAKQPGRLAYLVLHQWVLANYGAAASPEDAENFGASVLGLTREAYYTALCELSGQLDSDEAN